MLKAHTGIVALHDVAKVVDVRLHGWIILPVDVDHVFLAEWTFLELGIDAFLRLLLHRIRGWDLPAGRQA